MAVVRRAFAGATLLIISHRLAPVVEADVVFVMDEGAVAEAGGADAAAPTPGGASSQLKSTARPPAL